MDANNIQEPEEPEEPEDWLETSQLLLLLLLLLGSFLNDVEGHPGWMLTTSSATCCVHIYMR